MPPLFGRKILALGVGFGVGGGLAVLIEGVVGSAVDWMIALWYGLGLTAGMLVGLPVWSAVGPWLRPRLTGGARNRIFLGMPLGAAPILGIWGWARIQWLSVPEALPWLSEVLAALVLGLWSAFLFGVAFGRRLAEPPEGAEGG